MRSETAPDADDVFQPRFDDHVQMRRHVSTERAEELSLAVVRDMGRERIPTQIRHRPGRRDARHATDPPGGQEQPTRNQGHAEECHMKGRDGPGHGWSSVTGPSLNARACPTAATALQSVGQTPSVSMETHPWKIVRAASDIFGSSGDFEGLISICRPRMVASTRQGPRTASWKSGLVFFAADRIALRDAPGEPGSWASMARYRGTSIVSIFGAAGAVSGVRRADSSTGRSIASGSDSRLSFVPPLSAHPARKRTAARRREGASRETSCSAESGVRGLERL